MSQTSTLIASTTTDEDKYITFYLDGYCFALPSKYVLKIIVTPSSDEGGMVSMGLVQLSQYSIQILNLRALLKLEQLGNKPLTPQTSETTDNSSPTFLIILRAQKTEQELWGIVVEQSPDLQEISHSKLKPVPDSKRIADALNGISHIVAETPEHNESKESNRSLSYEDRQISLILDLPKLIELSKT